MLYPDENQNTSKLMELLGFKKFKISDTTTNSITIIVNNIHVTQDLNLNHYKQNTTNGNC